MSIISLLRRVKESNLFPSKVTVSLVGLSLPFFLILLIVIRLQGSQCACPKFFTICAFTYRIRKIINYEYVCAQDLKKKKKINI